MKRVNKGEVGWRGSSRRERQKEDVYEERSKKRTAVNNSPLVAVKEEPVGLRIVTEVRKRRTMVTEVDLRTGFQTHL